MDKMKAFNVRISKELWVFLKDQSIIQEKPMNSIIAASLEKMKKSLEKKLTCNNTRV
jgi:hypothetical protein